MAALHPPPRHEGRRGSTKERGGGYRDGFPSPSTSSINSNLLQFHAMSKTEIIAELPKLSAEDLADVQAKLDELAGEAWQDRGELTDADKQTLDATLEAYEKSPEA